MVGTSSASLVGRIVTVGAIAALLHEMHSREKDYDKCIERNENMEDECNKHLIGINRHNDDVLIGWLTFSLVVAAIYTMVSATGFYYGWVGCQAEKDAEKQVATDVQPPVPGAGGFAMSAPQVVVVQAQAVATDAPRPALVVNLQDQGAAAAEFPVVRANAIQNAVSADTALVAQAAMQSTEDAALAAAMQNNDKGTTALE